MRRNGVSDFASVQEKQLRAKVASLEARVHDLVSVIGLILRAGGAGPTVAFYSADLDAFNRTHAVEISGAMIARPVPKDAPPGAPTPDPVRGLLCKIGPRGDATRLAMP